MASAVKSKLTVAKTKEDTAKPPMNPWLLLLASRGDCDGITDHILLNMEAATQQKAAKEEGACHRPAPSADSSPLDQANPAIPTMATQQASGDDGHQSCLDLEGVTIEGDTALHVLATSGDGWSYLRSVEIICSKAPHLLLVQNNKGGTPLHCAVRAGHSQMVSFLIDLANNPRSNLQVAARLKEVLRKGTAFLPLHDAIRIGNKEMITKLLEFDPELASSPTDEAGISPLYLAIVLQRSDIAKLLHQMSPENLSYSGLSGQNALHAAVLQGKEMTEMLLNWNKDLTEQVDKNRSTPLHFAASLCKDFAASLSEYTVITWMSRTPLIPVLLANPVQLYQQDSEGLYPIHVAASSGAIRTIKYLIEEQPDEIAGLVDFKGRTFLHVAVERGRRNIVEYAHRTRSLARIFNMQDNDGNTAMHIAVRNGNKYIFCILLRNRKVNLNILNNQGQTPLEIADSKIHEGFYYVWNPEKLILLALTHCNASGGCRRADHFQKKQADEAKESEKLTTSTQTLGIGSVLIVTVTFGAILAIPGGYKADDHYNGGTPTLAGRYVFGTGSSGSMDCNCNLCNDDDCISMLIHGAIACTPCCNSDVC
nr:ankyrin-2 isoform X3 [Oryza sativa Japonica Group]